MRSMVTRVLSPLINHLLYWSADRIPLSSSQFSNLSLCGQTIPSWIAEVCLFEWMPNSKALFRFSFSVGSVVGQVFHGKLMLYLHCISLKIFLKVCFSSAFYLVFKKKKSHLQIKDRLDILPHIYALVTNLVWLKKLSFPFAYIIDVLFKLIFFIFKGKKA